jgi:outer membrane protein assembly factor BamB
MDWFVVPCSIRIDVLLTIRMDPNFGSADNNVYSIDANGNTLWTYTGITGAILNSPLIGYDKTIFIAASDLKLYAILPDGSGLKWEYALGGTQVCNYNQLLDYHGIRSAMLR